MIASVLVLSWFLSAAPAIAAGPSSTDTSTAAFRITKAVEKGDIPAVKSLLKSDPSLIGTKEPGLDDPLLVWAARKNQPAMVAFLLESGADIKATNRLGSNPLHLAAFTGNYAMMELLFQQGADWKERNQRGKIPVDYVSYGKNPKVFELFLSKDANMLQERTSDGATLLHMAASAGDTAGFSFLLAKGLDIRATDNRGTTVAHTAMESNDLVMLEYLGQQGANLDAGEKNGYTPLFWAVMSGNRDMTLFLLGHGADVNHRTKDGITPVMIAARRDSLFMVELLVSKGADLQPVEKEGRNALHISVIGGNLSIASYLAGRNIPLDARDKSGKTPLHYAAIYGYASIGRDLVERGADPSIADNEKHDAIYYCEWYGNLKLCQYLQEKEGKKPVAKDPVKPVATHLAKGQAVVHYLNHSGYAIETPKYLLVFDYFQPGESPSTPSLLNGHINPAELKGKKIIVFASHEHGDHYDTTIWGWRKANPGITYVMGFRPATSQSYEYIAPRETKTIDGVEIHAIRSTDTGEGFLVVADGLTIYHPGDHVNKSADLGPDFKGEVDYLAGVAKKVDIAFFPVSGCGFPDLEAVKRGNYYVIGEMKPGICFSMHGDNQACSTYSSDIVKTFASQPTAFGTYPGDRFVYHSN